MVRTSLGVFVQTVCDDGAFREDMNAYPSFRLSMKFGKVAWQYVEVQIRSKMTRRRDSKLKRAVYRGSLVSARGSDKDRDFASSHTIVVDVPSFR